MNEVDEVETFARLRCQLLEACDTLSALPPHPERQLLGQHLLKVVKMANAWNLMGTMDGSKRLASVR